MRPTRQILAGGRRGRAGVTLMEIVVALTLLSVVIVSLGGLMFQVSRSTRRATELLYLSGAVQRAQTTVEGLPWDSLASASAIGCVTDTTGQLIYSRCTTISTPSANLKHIQVVLSPTGFLGTPPDTVSVDRVKPGSKPPFRP